MPSHQRYVSNELTHFVGRSLASEADQYGLLVKILQAGWLLSPPFDPNAFGTGIHIDYTKKISTNEMLSPTIVCFCDIPVADLGLHVRKYSRFGLAFSKAYLIQKGANPVLYVPGNSVSISHDLAPKVIPRPEYFDDMLVELQEVFWSLRTLLYDQKSAVARDYSARLTGLDVFLRYEVFCFVKFFDDSLSDGDPENYYMEREWRVLGNVKFDLGDVRRLIVPETWAERLRQDIPQYSGQLTFVD